MELTPKVSVVMPVFNGEKFLREAVESILAQTLPDFEFIIVDDGSTDQSWEMIQAYAQNDGRIRAIRQPENQGLISTLNHGCGLARSPYVARMDCDDISLPTRLALQLDFLQRHPAIAVVGGQADWIDEAGTVFGATQVPSPANVVRWTMLFTCCIVHPTVMMRSDTLKMVGYYDHEALHCEDYDLWRRIARVADLANLPDILLRYRVRKDSITAQHNTQMTEGSIRVTRLWLSDLLNEDCSYDLAQAFRETSNADVAATVNGANTARYLREAYRCFEKKYSVSREEKRQIIQSVFRKHVKLTLAARKSSRIESLRLVFDTIGFRLFALLNP